MSVDELIHVSSIPDSMTLESSFRESMCSRFTLSARCLYPGKHTVLYDPVKKTAYRYIPARRLGLVSFQKTNATKQRTKNQTNLTHLVDMLPACMR